MFRNFFKICQKEMDELEKIEKQFEPHCIKYAREHPCEGLSEEQLIDYLKNSTRERLGFFSNLKTLRDLQRKYDDEVEKEKLDKP